jgi:hypothetical protein
VSGAQALMDCGCSFLAETEGDLLDIVLGVAVPVSQPLPVQHGHQRLWAAGSRRPYRDR